MINPSILVIAPVDIFVHIQQQLSDWYDIGIATNTAMANSWLRHRQPDVILLDSVTDQYDRKHRYSQQLKMTGSKTQGIPIVLLAHNQEQLLDSYQLDVVDCLLLPISLDELKRRVRVHVTLRQTQKYLLDHNASLEQHVCTRTVELENSQRAAIHMLGEAGHYNDTDTGVHIWRMAAYCAELAKACGWSETDCRYLELAAPMHDTGKIGIPDKVLRKQGPLDANEWEVMKGHTTIGWQILSLCKQPLFSTAAEIAYSHHEKWDGSGYPQGLKGEDIPESARIVAIADVFDALTMKRPYKKAWSNADAVAEVSRSAGTHFDPEMTEMFIDIMPRIEELQTRFNTSI